MTLNARHQIKADPLSREDTRHDAIALRRFTFPRRRRARRGALGGTGPVADGVRPADGAKLEHRRERQLPDSGE